MRFSVQDRYDIANYVISSINEDEWKGKFYKHTSDFGEYESRSIFDTIYKDIGRFVRSQELIKGSKKQMFVYQFKHLTEEDLPKVIEFP